MVGSGDVRSIGRPTQSVSAARWPVDGLQSIIRFPAPTNMRRTPILAVLLLIQSCVLAPPESEGIGNPVPWDRLDGWETDRHAEAWPTLLRSCTKLEDRPSWSDVCRAATTMADPTDRQVKTFFEKHFRPHPVRDDKGRRQGLITGYFEPLLRGSRQPGGRYRYPLYRPPPDLLTLDLGEAYPEIEGRGLGGRLEGNTVRPYPARKKLEASPGILSGNELLWIDDPVDVFFLHVQGSGRVRLPDGRIVAVGFADHNGRPYRSIGRRLIDTGELDREDVDLFSIRQWLRQHPDRARALLHHNPRYVFFRLGVASSIGPTGALNVPLTAGRSMAVDPDAIPLGVPIWLETSSPGRPDTPLNRLMMAQDTGGAIKGYNRGDVFWGSGDTAERNAGRMKQPGRMFVLLPHVD